MEANIQFIAPARMFLYGVAKPNTILSLFSAVKGSALNQIGQVSVEPSGNFETEIQFQNTANTVKILEVRGIAPNEVMSITLDVIKMQQVQQPMKFSDGISNLPLGMGNGEAPRAAEFQSHLGSTPLPGQTLVERTNMNQLQAQQQLQPQAKSTVLFKDSTKSKKIIDTV